MVMKLQKSSVIWNREVSPGYSSMGLGVEDAYEAAQPGQFVMVRTTGEGETLLRRPFSIHDVRRDGKGLVLELLYKVVGPNTAIYGGLKEGDMLSVLGPLGNAFKKKKKGENSFLAGGGIGIAPMRFLARKLLEKGNDPKDHTIFVGGRSKDDVLTADVLRDLGFCVVETTDDGSLGEKGRITAPMAHLLKKRPPAKVYACGPHPMLEGVARLFEPHDALCELSLEIIMACGMGACMGCVVAAKDESAPYHHVCIEGPVFDAKFLKI